MREAQGRWRPWRRAASSPAPPASDETLEAWAARLAGRLDTVIDDLLPPIEDAVGSVREDPALAGGDELTGRRAGHALERLAGELGGISGSLRAGPPGAMPAGD